MRVNEIFTSIQGEGPLSGRYCTFIRLHGCNLSCPWCDTKYANDTYINATPQEVASSVIHTGLDHAVITGGEPMIQLETLDLGKLLRQAGIHVTLETNGTICPPTLMEQAFDLIMVSPKSLDVAEEWMDKVLNYKFKFVVDGNNVDTAMDWIKQKGIKDAYFMPLGWHIDEMMQNAVVIINKMREHRVNGTLCTRLQVLFRIR